MRFGKLRPTGKVLDHWQLLHEYEVTGSAITSYAITSPYNVLMISGEGANNSTTVIDECGKSVTCNGDAKIDTSQFKFGASSVKFDGTGDYLSLADSADWDYGANNFTIDFWLRPNAYPAVTARLYHHKNTGNSALIIIQYNSTGSITFNVQKTDGSDVIVMTSANTFATGSWYHVAVARNGNNWYLFVNGVTEAFQSGVSDTIADLNSTLYIGIHSDLSSYPFNGWLDDYRISKGIARWTSNFTPPLKTTALINGDTDEEYKLLVEMINSTGAGAYAYLRLNNDSAANYGDQNLYGDNATITAIRNTAQGTFYIAYTNAANKLSFAEATIYAKSGYPRTILNTRSESVTGTTVERIRQLGGVWNNSTAPIAALYLFSEGLDVGSKFLLYRKVT